MRNSGKQTIKERERKRQLVVTGLLTVTTPERRAVRLLFFAHVDRET
jgi:hypothetical protein